MQVTVRSNRNFYISSQVCGRGARFKALVLDPCDDARGRELDDDAFPNLNPRLEEFFVGPVSGPAAQGSGADKTPSANSFFQIAAEKTKRFSLFVGLSLVLLFIILTQGAVYDLIKAYSLSVFALRDVDDFGWIEAALAALDGGHLPWAGMFLAVGLALMFLIFRMRHRFVRSTITRSDRIKPAKTLIQGLSDLDGLNGSHRKQNETALATARRLTLERIPFSWNTPNLRCNCGILVD